MFGRGFQQIPHCMHCLPQELHMHQVSCFCNCDRVRLVILFCVVTTVVRFLVTKFLSGWHSVCLPVVLSIVFGWVGVDCYCSSWLSSFWLPCLDTRFLAYILCRVDSSLETLVCEEILPHAVHACWCLWLQSLLRPSFVTLITPDPKSIWIHGVIPHVAFVELGGGGGEQVGLRDVLIDDEGCDTEVKETEVVGVGHLNNIFTSTRLRVFREVFHTYI